MHAGWSANFLKAFDGVTAQVVLPSPIYDFKIDGNTIYTLANDGQVRKSRDLVTWRSVATAPLTSQSIAVFKGSVYVGGTDSSLYKLR